MKIRAINIGMMTRTYFLFLISPDFSFFIFHFSFVIFHFSFVIFIDSHGEFLVSVTCHSLEPRLVASYESAALTNEK